MLTVPTYTLPANPLKDASKATIRVWEKEVDDCIKKKKTLKQNLKTTYSLIYGQCTDALCTKLESRPGHSTIAAKADSIELLKSIKAMMFQFQAQ